MDLSPFLVIINASSEIVRHDVESLEDRRIFKVAESRTVEARERHRSRVRLVAGHRVGTLDRC